MHGKYTISKKDHKLGENIAAYHKRLISLIYKELFKIKKRKINELIFKKQAKDIVHRKRQEVGP